MDDNVPPSSLPLSRNLGALTSWNPLGLSRPVMGLLYLYVVRLVDSWNELRVGGFGPSDSSTAKLVRRNL